MKLFTTFIVIIFISTGCSSYSKQKCLEIDQAQSGYKLGIDGVTSFNSAILDLKKNCEDEHGVPVDTQKIKTGWEDGLRFYCSSNGGSRAGQSGLVYSGACTKQDEKIFFNTYNPSRMSYLENKVKELEKKIEVLESDFSNATSRANSCESNVNSLYSRLSSAEAKASSCL